MPQLSPGYDITARLPVSVSACIIIHNYQHNIPSIIKIIIILVMVVSHILVSQHCKFKVRLASRIYSYVIIIAHVSLVVRAQAN